MQFAESGRDFRKPHRANDGASLKCKITPFPFVVFLYSFLNTHPVTNLNLQSWLCKDPRCKSVTCRQQPQINYNKNYNSYKYRFVVFKT